MLYVDPINTYALPGSATAGQQSEFRQETLQAYEQLFLYRLLQEMRRTVPKSGLFGNSQQQKLFEDMLDDVLAAEMARSGQLGVAKEMEEQLRALELRQQLDPAAQYPDGIPVSPEIKGIPLTADRGIPLKRNENSGIRIQSNRNAESRNLTLRPIT